MATLDSAASRSETVRVDVYDPYGNQTGVLHPQPGASVSVDVDRRIVRQLSGLDLDVDQTQDIDPYRDRLQPVWTVDNTDWPLGVYVWGAANRVRSTFGVEYRSATCYGLGFVLDQPLPKPFGVSTSQKATERLRDLVEQAGVVDHDIDHTGLTPDKPLAWAAGQPRRDAAGKLLDLAGRVGFFDNDGVYVVRRRRVPEVDLPDHFYDEGGRVQAPVDEADDPWGQPNRWTVISTSATDSAIVGTYRLPDQHPASQENRGFEVVEVVEEAGITSTAAADQRAREAAKDKASETVELTTVADPRHDVRDLVWWQAEVYVEKAWELELRPGGRMRHTLRRVRDA